MKKLFYLSVITLFFCANFVHAQDNFGKQCGAAQPELNDDKNFDKAKDCKNSIVGTVKIVHLAKSCKEFDINSDGNWVVLLSEYQDVYQERKAEFQKFENRLEKLIGVDADHYKCLVVLEVSAALLRKPTEKDDNKSFPFTNKGFTCDWYYGDGCRYGLSEFILKSDKTRVKEIVRYVINNDCFVDSYAEKRCKEFLPTK